MAELFRSHAALRWAVLLPLVLPACSSSTSQPVAPGDVAQPGSPTEPSPPARPGPSIEPGPSLVYLDQSRNWRIEIGDQQRTCLLARELVRQAFLMAARDEGGLATRDFWLGEALLIEGNDVPFDIAVGPGEPLMVEVLRASPGGPTRLARHELRVTDRVDYKALAVEFESLSRTKFAEALKQAGFRQTPRVWKPELPLPEAQERQLGEMGLLSQFQAIRAIHAMIRTEGESPARLGGLVRGYSNLGVLTEFLWHPAHKVFKARALLYAQRIVAKDGTSVAAKWHRAYAAALAGRPLWALADLKEAEEAWQAMAEERRPARPAWVELIGPFCRYEIELLAKSAAVPSTRELATLLRYLAVEQSGGDSWAVRTAIEALDAVPECCRIQDGFCEFGGVRALHAATLLPWEVMASTFYGRLRAMPGLPENVRSLVEAAPARLRGEDLFDEDGTFKDKGVPFQEEVKRRSQIIEALVKSDRRTAPPGAEEPSWATLGLLLRELSFLHVWRRAHFEARSLGWSTDDWLMITAPLAERHRYFVLLATYVSDGRHALAARKLLGQVDPVGVECPAHRLFDELAKSDAKQRTAFSREAYANLDSVVRDLAAAVRQSKNSVQSAALARRLLAVSPQSPLARTELVQHDWEAIQRLLPAWEKGAGPFPPLSAALGAQYVRLERWDDAERSYRAALAVMPDPVYFQKLASVYQKRGQTDRWLATLQECLKHPDYGLHHFAVQRDIAQHFMDRKEWAKAWPYAEAATQASAGWTLLCAGECCEALQRWEAAEKYFRKVSERYRGSRLDWYFFCRRTGQGDREGARRLARTLVEDLAEQGDRDHNLDFAVYYLLEAQPEKALPCLEQRFSKSGDAGAQLQAALIAHQLKDLNRRDAAIRQVKNEEPVAGSPGTGGSKTGFVALADLFFQDLAQEAKGRVVLAKAELARAAAAGADRAEIDCLLAQYLALHGRRDEAVRYWKQCMGSVKISGHSRTLAGAALYEHGIPPEAYRSLVNPDDRTPIEANRK